MYFYESTPPNCRKRKEKVEKVGHGPQKTLFCFRFLAMSGCRSRGVAKEKAGLSRLSFRLWRKRTSDWATLFSCMPACLGTSNHSHQNPELLGEMKGFHRPLIWRGLGRLWWWPYLLGAEETREMVREEEEMPVKEWSEVTHVFSHD